MKPVTYFQYYIDLNGSENPLTEMQSNLVETLDLLADIPESKAHYAYEKGKWTVNQLVQHLIDTERIFQYRALTFAREKNAVVTGYDHDVYANSAPAAHVTLEQLVKHFGVLRASSIAMFDLFDESELHSIGTANKIEMTVQQIGLIIPGHVRHHIGVLEERYL